MTYDELLALPRRFEGQSLETVTGKKFRVGVYLDCPSSPRLIPRSESS